MIDTDKYEGHTTDWEWKDKEWGVALCGGDSSAGVCGEICCDTPDGNLAQDAPLLLEAYKRLREALVGDSKDWTTDELVKKVLTLYDKALVFDTIYDWYERMQLQSESYENKLWRMDWLLKNPTREYEDYDKEMIE